VAQQLSTRGAVVSVYDPVAADTARRAFPTLRYCSSLKEAATGAQVLLHLTEWDEFRDLDPQSIDDVVAARYVLDGRNTLDPERWRAAGWTYQGFGRA
jgi:UDPglucose 6-dehydrogenase